MDEVLLHSPALYDDISQAVAAVARRRGPAHVDNEDELVLIRPFHKDADVENIPRAEDHLALPVRVAVRSVLVERHLGDEVSLLGG